MNGLRTAVITGASRGLGLASAAHLYGQGWRVVAAVRSPDSASAALRGETGAGADDPRLLTIRLDITQQDSILAAAAEIERAVGAPDALVHNAGIAASGCVEEMPPQVWQQMFATNLFGPVALTKALLPAMRLRGSGRIVVVSSVGGARGMPSISAYSASKGAVERWGEALAEEIAPFGLGVTVLLPGAFATDIITEKTPEYGNLKGPYAAHYAGMRLKGGAMVNKAQPPAVFARALAKALDDRGPFARHIVGSDAVQLSLMARFLPGRALHNLIRKALGLPAFGSLRVSAPADEAALRLDPAPAKRDL